MAEINTDTSNKKRRSGSRLLNHRSTRVDLTPMVDLGFLLLSFFVFTSAMSETKAMDLYEPHNDGFTKVKASASLTILLGRDHRLYYYPGILADQDQSSQIGKTNFRDIRSLILQLKKNTDPSYLMYLVKSSRKSTFGDNINLLDEMIICDIAPGHYAEVDMTEGEEDEIMKISLSPTEN